MARHVLGSAQWREEASKARYMGSEAMGRGLIPQRMPSLLAGAPLLLLLPASAEAGDYSDRELKRSLRSELKERDLRRNGERVADTIGRPLLPSG
jgi:hypothetical protein